MFRDVAPGFADVFRHVAASTKNDFRSFLGDAGELEIVRRERVLVAERDGGDPTCGLASRIHGGLLRGEREQ